MQSPHPPKISDGDGVKLSEHRRARIPGATTRDEIWSLPTTPSAVAGWPPDRSDWEALV